MPIAFHTAYQFWADRNWAVYAKCNAKWQTEWQIKTMVGNEKEIERTTYCLMKVAIKFIWKCMWKIYLFYRFRPDFGKAPCVCSMRSVAPHTAPEDSASFHLHQPQVWDCAPLVLRAVHGRHGELLHYDGRKYCSDIRVTMCNETNLLLIFPVIFCCCWLLLFCCLWAQAQKEICI